MLTLKSPLSFCSFMQALRTFYSAVLTLVQFDDPEERSQIVSVWSLLETRCLSEPLLALLAVVIASNYSLERAIVIKGDENRYPQAAC